VLYANGATSSTTFPLGASPLTGATVKRAVALLAAGLVPTFADGTYHAIIHPGATFDLMSDTAVGGWIDAARYAGSRPLLTGEIGEYAGVRFITAASAGQKLATSGATLPTVTGTAATDLINSTAHGLTAGQRVKLTGLTGGAGLVSGTTYYVVGPVTANTFKVALTPNGTPIDITTDLTAVTTPVQVYDVNSTTIFGPEAYAFGDWTNIETYITMPGGPGDELHQRASVGWKGFFGAVIIGQGTNATNVSPPRYIRVESVSPIS
jgi:hypothetical protein